MNRYFLGLAMSLMAASAPASALALTVDFTDSSLFGSGDLSQSYTLGAPVLVTLSSTGSGGGLSFTSYDGGLPKPTTPLALNWDGVGVGASDDEITSPGEEITVSFDSMVAVTGLYFLDLFTQSNGSDKEVANVTNGNGWSDSFDATAPFQTNAGYLFVALASPVYANLLSFTAGSTNDGQGNPDYALAGLEITAVPLPAGLPLLAGGLGVMALLGRRTSRKRAVRA